MVQDFGIKGDERVRNVPCLKRMVSPPISLTEQFAADKIKPSRSLTSSIGFLKVRELEIMNL